MITHEQYLEYSKLVEEYEQFHFEENMRQAEQDLEIDDDYDPDHDEDDFDEYDDRLDCRCGAYELNNGKIIHIADCICGAG